MNLNITPKIAVTELLKEHTQQELSKLTGVGQGTISRILNGRYKSPGWNVAWPLVRFFLEKGVKAP